MITTLATLICLQTPVPSMVLPASGEDRIVFTHAGYTYTVGKQTGKVEVLGAKPPIPPDDPVPVAEVVRYVSLIVDPASADQAKWRVNSEVRKLVESGKITLYTYTSNESDVDTLGFRPAVTASGTPIMIFQAKDGKLVKVRKIDSEQEFVQHIRMVTPQ